MTIEVVNRQKRIPINPPQLTRAVKNLLRLEGFRKVQLSIVFVTDRKIKSLNQKYLNHPYPTDVLSFDYRAPAKRAREISGEIIISTDTAQRNAVSHQTTGLQEIMRYVIHGVLHLLGFDDHAQRDIEKMRRKENQWMRLLKYDP